MSRFRRPTSRGAVAVEFALTVPLLLLLVLGIVEFSAALAVKGTVAAATKDAARDYAIWGPNAVTTSDLLGRVSRRVQENGLAAGLIIGTDKIFIEACSNTQDCINGGKGGPAMKSIADIMSQPSAKNSWTKTPICPWTPGYVLVQVKLPWTMLSGGDVRGLTSIATGGAAGIGPTFTIDETSRMQCGG